MRVCEKEREKLHKVRGGVQRVGWIVFIFCLFVALELILSAKVLNNHACTREPTRKERERAR